MNDDSDGQRREGTNTPPKVGGMDGGDDNLVTIERVAVTGGTTDDDDNRYTCYRAVADVQVIGALASTGTRKNYFLIPIC